VLDNNVKPTVGRHRKNKNILMQKMWADMDKEEEKYIKTQHQKLNNRTKIRDMKKILNITRSVIKRYDNTSSRK
jgi:hypothetical protein